MLLLQVRRLRFGAATTPKTVKHPGSMSKMFTAVAIAQLAQAGKLEFTDRVGKYLPDYPNKDLASKVTIHRLLTHTGGTGDIFGPQFVAHRQELSETGDYVTFYGKPGLEFEPGARYSYSNYGFMLLGVIVEKATGQSYYDYVRERIFKVAGMASTDSFPESMSVPGRAVGLYRQSSAARRISGWRLFHCRRHAPFRRSAAEPQTVERSIHGTGLYG